jgi:DNA-binding transcriptional LysR family regulator
LKLALSQTVDLSLLVPPLTELTRSFPGLELKFLRGTGEAVLQHLKAGDCDVAVAGRLGEDWDRLDSWLLFAEGFQLVADRRHPLLARNQVSLSDLGDVRVFARSHCENAAEFAAALSASGGAADDIGSDQDLLKLVEAGLGVGILPQSTHIGGSLKSAMLSDLAVRREVRLYAVAGRQRSPAAAALVKILRAADWTRVMRESLSVVA